MRLVNNVPTFVGKQVEIDNQETVEYESVCGKCYLKLKKQYGKSIK